MEDMMMRLLQMYVGKPVCIIKTEEAVPISGTLDSVTARGKDCFHCGHRENIVLGVKLNSGSTVMDFDLSRHEKILKLSYFDGRRLESFLNTTMQRLEHNRLFISSLKNVPTDFSIEACDGTIIEAHKLVLCARSRVFAAMIGAEMKEGISGRVLIKGFTGEGLEVFVGTLYNMVHPKTGSHIGELLQLAHIYDVGPVLSLVPEDDLKSLITSENAAEVLFVGGKVGDIDIMRFSMECIRKDKEVVLASDGWKIWSEAGISFVPGAWKTLVDWINS